MTQRFWFTAWMATIAGGFCYGWFVAQSDEANTAESASAVSIGHVQKASGIRETRLIDEVLGERSAAKRRHVLAEYAVAGGEDAIVQAIDALKKAAKGPRQSFALDELFHAWGKVAPLNALRAIVAEPQRTQWRWQKQILTGWSDIDSPAAWTWLQQNVSVESPATLFGQAFRYEQYGAIVEYLLKNDRPREVEALLAATSVSRIQQGVSGSLVQYFASYDLAGGVRWVNQQPLGAARTNAVAVITSSIAAQAPDIAIPFAMGLTEMADRMQALRTAFAAAGKAEDYSAATRWILNQKAARPEMSAALNGFIPQIASRDPELAIKLINERSDLSDRIDLVDKAVASVRLESLDKAFGIIVGVPVNSKRADQLATVVKLWAARDPAAARAAIERQPALTNAERETLLRSVTQ
jgi:hypothetical protein